MVTPTTPSPAPALFLVDHAPFVGAKVWDLPELLTLALRPHVPTVRALRPGVWLVSAQVDNAGVLYDLLRGRSDPRDHILVVRVAARDVEGSLSPEDRRWLLNGRATLPPPPARRQPQAAGA